VALVDRADLLLAIIRPFLDTPGAPSIRTPTLLTGR
jgi:hypothetical protein